MNILNRTTALGVCWAVACTNAPPTERPPPASAAGSTGAGGHAGSSVNGGAGIGGASPGGASGSAGAPSASGGSAGAASGNGGASGDGSSGAAGASEGCEGHDYLLCEDFESTELGGTPDGWSKHGDASGVDDQEAKHGSHSLKLGAIPSWERRIYHEVPMLGASHYGRIFYRVALPVPDAFVHSTLVAFGGDGPTIGPAEFRVVDTVKQAVDTPDVASRHQFLYNVQPQSGAEFGTGTSYDWYFDGEWHCAEWFVDATTQTYLFWFDGAQQIEIQNGAGSYGGTELPMSFDEVRVGFINYQEAPPGFTAWIDDVVLDVQRVGCD